MNKNTLQIQSVMHPFPHSIGVDQTLAVAKKMFAEHNIRHLPVQKGGELAGILTERDLHFTISIERKTPEHLKVEEAYTREPYVVSPTTAVEMVARKMAHDHLGCALIVDKGKLVGIFTTVDACRALAELLSGNAEQ